MDQEITVEGFCKFVTFCVIVVGCIFGVRYCAGCSDVNENVAVVGKLTIGKYGRNYQIAYFGDLDNRKTQALIPNGFDLDAVKTVLKAGVDSSIFRVMVDRKCLLDIKRAYHTESDTTSRDVLVRCTIYGDEMSVKQHLDAARFTPEMVTVDTIPKERYESLVKINF